MTVFSIAALAGQKLSCRRGFKLLFEQLDVSARSGRALVVTGPNGAGKSSLLRILAGLLAPTAGQVRLEGAAADSSLREHLHYLGHDDAVKGALTVRANLAFWRQVLGPTGLGVEDALEEVGLGGLGGLKASVLSAGQKRRLAIARLLVSRRPAWVLDEPTTALDARAQARFAAFGRAHLAAGGVLVAATHAPLDLGESDELQLSGRALLATEAEFES
ncbi:heme ABC exporter ATP-binding protein CcmA [Xanthobacter sp. V4C-4]|uniref:heme ABC exporter ATP-binding protein CcmA n=1 Tax=Xanthobacter cornucopiae TaxID=3119924 RepID=UPI003729F50D